MNAQEHRDAQIVVAIQDLCFRALQQLPTDRGWCLLWAWKFRGLMRAETSLDYAVRQKSVSSIRRFALNISREIKRGKPWESYYPFC
jgi:hypothetical protein